MPQKTIIPFESLPTYPVDSEVTVVDLTKDGLPFIPVLGDAHYSRPGDGTVPHVHPGMIEILFCRRGEELSFDCAGEVVRFAELVVGAPHASYWKSIMRYIGLDCGPARSPAGQPLAEAEYAAYAKKLDALGFIRRNAAL